MSRTLLAALLFAGTALVAGCTDVIQPDPQLSVEAPQFSATSAACWGQATKAFAALGVMGAHASEQPNPRVGLANLARQLYKEGVIGAPTMQALGAFVASAEGLSIDACMS